MNSSNTGLGKLASPDPPRFVRYHSAGTELISVSGNGSGWARNNQCQEFSAHSLLVLVHTW